MFKKKTDLTTSEAPETVVAVAEVPVAKKPTPPPAKPQAFPGLKSADVNREVTCHGGGPYDGTWTVPAPIPQELHAGSAIYNLSDRHAGVYTYRVR